MTSDRHDDYLWDGTGEPDPEVVRLEQVLGTLRHDGPLGGLPPFTVDARSMPDAPASLGRRVWYAVSTLAAAAGLILMAGAAWLTVLQPRIGWAVEPLAGDPVVDGQSVGRNSRLAVGGWLETDTASRARINAGPIGRIVVEPNTRVQLVEARGREHRIGVGAGHDPRAHLGAAEVLLREHARGRGRRSRLCLHAACRSRWFGPRACDARLGGVSDGDRESFIPEQGVCATRPGVGPGTPRYEDAPDVYAAALDLLDFGDPSDSGRGGALDLVLSRARPRDALTLWHLLRRGSPDERARVYERMTSVSPPPSGVTREAILRRDRSAIDAWWNSLGLDSTTWWRMWKKDW